MMRDVIFTIKDTNVDLYAYDEWKIVLTNVENTLPLPKTVTLDIKGADGLLDLSEALTGDVLFNNRKLKLTFELMNLNSYDELLTEIANTLHGRVVNLRFTSDDDYYYTGRATISKWECKKHKGSIVIDIDAYPYKLSVLETTRQFTISGNQTININVNTRKTLVPILEVTGNLILNDLTLTEGKSQYSDIILKNGVNTFTASGKGTIKFIYRSEVL